MAIDEDKREIFNRLRDVELKQGQLESRFSNGINTRMTTMEAKQTQCEETVVGMRINMARWAGGIMVMSFIVQVAGLVGIVEVLKMFLGGK